MINFVIPTCLSRQIYVKSFNHVHELPDSLKLVYAYYFFNVKARVSEMLAGLIWSTHFKMALD